MRYRRLSFSGDTHAFFRQIIETSDSVLLLPEDHRAENVTYDPTWGSDTKHIGLYTSATTGPAKSIWNSFDRLQKNARITASAFEITCDDRLLMLAKPWHVAGLSWALMAEDLGCQYHFMPTRSGESDRWHQAIRQYSPDYLLTVPAVLRVLFSYDNWHIPSIVFGGSPVETADYQPLFDHTETIYQGYGQTEAGGLISCHKVTSLVDVSEHTCYCYGQPPAAFNIDCTGTPYNPQPIYLKSPTAIYRDYYNTGDTGYTGSDKLYLLGRS
jgi:acyl-coenzyme A synthetase/AMP-(fatty) acid ligase